jgi:mannitol-specific phosphotransferase system IIBC component
MATEGQFTILLWEIGIAVAIQAGVLIAILLVVVKSATRMESIANDIHQRAVPLLETTSALVASSKPQVETIIANLTESTTKLKTQVEDIADRTRQHVERADELVTRTMNKVEETTDFVQHTVITPARQLAGVFQGLSMGINVLFGRRGPGHASRSGNGSGAPRDEMFI